MLYVHVKELKNSQNPPRLSIQTEKFTSPLPKKKLKQNQRRYSCKMVMFQDQCINVRGICRRLESLLKSQSDFILKIRIKRLDIRYSKVRGGSF